MLLAITINVFSQKQERLPVLTKQEMLEDFTYLYNVISEANPQLTIRKKVTGVDILKNIKSLYSELDTITQFQNFYLLIEKALNLCHDMHYSIEIPYKIQKNIDKKSIALNEKYYQIISEEVFRPWGLSVLKYYNGRYYFYTPVKMYNNRQEINIEVGSELVELGGIPVDNYITSLNPFLTNRTTFDKELKKLFSISPVPPVSSANSTTIREKNGNIIHTGSGISIEKNCSNAMRSPFVVYFPDTKILFIRIPEMDTKLINYYKKEIPKIAKNKEIRKVVIDVRSNEGGNDMVWHSVLAAIIKDTLTARQRLLVRNTPTILKYMEEIMNQQKDIIPTIEIPFLDNESFIEFSLAYDDKAEIRLCLYCQIQK